MTKKDLFCIKTNKGYGLFQEYDSYPNSFNYIFYLVYYSQIEKQSDTEIMQALKGEYYYERIGFNVWRPEFSKEKLIANPKVEFCAKDFGISENDWYYKQCFITYLGKYDLPLGVNLPKFSRQLDISYFTGKHKWYIYNEMTNSLERNDKGNFISYKQLKDEIKSYPRYYVTPPSEILKRFNADYRQYNDDEWENIEMENYYQQHPDMRPVSLDFDTVKFPLPTHEMKKHLCLEVNKDDYIDFCNELEKIFLIFLKEIEQNKNSIKRPLVTLIRDLNNIEKETELINTMEAELIYSYIVNILKSLKKQRLIETVEEYRKW